MSRCFIVFSKLHSPTNHCIFHICCNVLRSTLYRPSIHRCFVFHHKMYMFHVHSFCRHWIPLQIFLHDFFLIPNYKFRNRFYNRSRIVLCNYTHLPECKYLGHEICCLWIVLQKALRFWCLIIRWTFVKSESLNLRITSIGEFWKFKINFSPPYLLQKYLSRQLCWKWT